MNTFLALLVVFVSARSAGPPTEAEHPRPSFSRSVESDYPWVASDLATQSRSPCPMLNSLANHGMLPRDGRNISAIDFADAFKRHLNIEWGFGWLVSHTSIETVKKTSTIDLIDLKLHNGIQHDAALTRNDMGFGEYYTQKNQTLIDQFIALNNSGYISYNEIAIARLLREQQSKAWNPNFVLPGRLNLELSKNKWFIAIDQAVTGLVTLSDPGPDTEKNWPSGRVRADHFRFFLENERLPFSLGWKQSSIEVSKEMVIVGVAKTASTYLWNSFRTIQSPIGLYAAPDPNPNQIL